MEKTYARTTIQDVAREAGVTKVTVSQALSGKGRVSEKTRRHVQLIAKQLQYQPNPHARSLTNGRSDVISLFSTDWHPGAYSEKIGLIQSMLNERGYDVPLHGYGFRRTSEPQAQANLIDSLLQQRPHAIICSTRDHSPEVTRALQGYQEQGGIVVSYGWESSLDCDQVLYDYGGSIYQAARHLVELGHSKIGLFNPGVKVNENKGVRLKAFRRALKQGGHAVREEWIVDGTPFEEGGAELARYFLALPEKPTAFCIVNDASASTFVHELMRAGLRVPADVCVVGQDNTPQAQYCMVPLTTIQHPSDVIATEVVEMVRSRIEGAYSGPSRRIVTEGKLIKRDSTAALTVK